MTNNEGDVAGGIYAIGAVNVLRSEITGNSGVGVGVFDRGHAYIYQTEISSNTGGVKISGEQVEGTIVESFIHDNHADLGGGIDASNLTLIRSTVSGNTATLKGGGVWSSYNLTILQSTVSGNMAAHEGGGVFTRRNLTLSQSTVTDNHLSHIFSRGGGVFVHFEGMKVEGSIVAGNTAANSPDVKKVADATFRYTLLGDSSGTNLAETPVGSTDEDGNLIGGPIDGAIDALLGPLASNGGVLRPKRLTIPTHALLPGSAAIDMGDPDFDPSDPDGNPLTEDATLFDQRGAPFVREFGGRIDIGAYERQTFEPSLLRVTTADDEVDYANEATSLREAINLANAIPGPDVITFDASLSGQTIILDGRQIEIAEAAVIDASMLDEKLTINAQHESRIFNLTAREGDLTLRGMTLTRGRTTADNAAIGPESLAQDGGAVRSASRGLLVLDQMHVTHSRTEGARAHGGGVFTVGLISIRDSTFAFNSATGERADGGGVHATPRSFENNDVMRSEFIGNQASGAGGAMNIGRLAAVEITVRGNSAGREGGGLHAFGETTIARSTVSDNTSHRDGGGIRVNHAVITDSTITDNRVADNGDGGGVFATGDLTVARSVVTGNSLWSGSGGGIDASYAGHQLTVTDSVVSNNIGGGIHGSTYVTILDSTISGNSNAHSVGGVSGWKVHIARSVIEDNDSRALGGVHSSNELTIKDSVISGNRAGRGGGGVWGRSVTITRAKIADNIAANDAGGVSASTLRINNSTVSGNQVLNPNGFGGGIRSTGPAYLSQTVVSGNVIEGYGGRGAGIWSHDRIVLAQSTITDNRATSADGAGGGIWIDEPVEDVDSIVSSGSIIADNIAAGGSADINAGVGGLLFRHSLIGDNDDTGLPEAPVGSPDEHGNLIGGASGGVIDPLLGPLADNGGFTLPDGSRILMHALHPGSPAIDMGDPDFDPGDPDGDPATDDAMPFDQRGAAFARVFGGRIDIGAFEVQDPGGALSADFDGNGRTDGHDFLAQQRSFGVSGSATLADGDATGEGDVDQFDLQVWEVRFGDVSVSPLQSGPSRAELIDAALANSGLRPALDEVETSAPKDSESPMHPDGSSTAFSVRRARFSPGERRGWDDDVSRDRIDWAAADDVHAHDDGRPDRWSMADVWAR